MPATVWGLAIQSFFVYMSKKYFSNQTQCSPCWTITFFSCHRTTYKQMGEYILIPEWFCLESTSQGFLWWLYLIQNECTLQPDWRSKLSALFINTHSTGTKEKFEYHANPKFQSTNTDNILNMCILSDHMIILTLRKPGVLQSMGSQRAEHDWENELNWQNS